ncbi:uncharacterized protein LOC112490965 isoform X3 [Ziziphus jujuba]|uniref:Uncharacterized protein LOC112490965 isoform X3 n=1 Tax=Ziziphus jujuba TaxID=326968 RepID=A0ABM4AF47_ZIZJJ|nr:uncharacterized protein LOC112490965 isoform X3 [Ziziphus jujuba]
MSSQASPSTSPVLPFSSPKTACCIQESTVSVNPLLHGMWMLEMIAAAYLLVKALLCRLLMMVFKVIEKFPRIWDYRAFTLPPSLDVKPPVKCQLSVSTFYCKHILQLFLYYSFLNNSLLKEIRSSFTTNVSAVAWLWTNCSRIVAPLVHFTQTNLCHFSSGRLLLKKYGLAFMKMCQQIIPKKLSSWRRIMVFGKLKGKKVRKAAVMCMKYLSTIIAPRKSKNAMQVIRMLEDHRLSTDAQGTLFENLGSDTLKLEGWDELADPKPDVLSFLDISVYELHIRDFNASDHAMETKFPGGYLTFTMQVGMAANLRDFVLTDYEGTREYRFSIPVMRCYTQSHLIVIHTALVIGSTEDSIQPTQNPSTSNLILSLDFQT